MQGFAIRSRSRVRIYVTDVNDNPPSLNADAAVGFIRENNPATFNILKLHPVDYDLPAKRKLEEFTFRIADETLAKVVINLYSFSQIIFALICC